MFLQRFVREKDSVPARARKQASGRDTGIWQTICIAIALFGLSGCGSLAGLASGYERELQMEVRSDGKGVVRYIIKRKAPDLREPHVDAPAEYHAWLAQRRARDFKSEISNLRSSQEGAK